MHERYLQTICLGIVILLLCGCSRSYTAFHFSYPPESKPHEDNWEYYGEIVAWDPFLRKSTEKGKRRIQIIIQDKEDNIVLEDELELHCAPIGREIIWPTLEKLSIQIHERGNPFADDEYNRRLTKEGPRHLISLVYFWNGQKYISRNAEQQNAADACGSADLNL